ncbi:MAG: sulfurtransferase [Acidobacteriota bacterium]
MRRIVLTFAVAVVWFSFTSPTAGKTPKVRKSMIVTTEWLAKHLNDNSLVLLHVGDKKEYDAAHIPGAQFIQMSDISKPRGEGLSLELPPVDQLKATFEKFGVSKDARIVIYFGKDWVTPTSRVYFTLDYLGLGNRASILDGGLPAWMAEKRPVTTEVSAPRPGRFTPRPNPKLVVDSVWVSANLNKSNVAILDARNSEFYTGAQAGTMPRAGRIPRARSIPFGSLIQDANSKFESPDVLRKIFSAADVKKGDSVATYCHIGQQASLLYFIARYLGYDAHLYDGSFQDWSNRSELPVEKSETP